MERRVLLAIFLSFLVLYVWQALFVTPVPEAGAGDAASRARPRRRRPAPPAPDPAAQLPAAPAAATPTPAAAGRRRRSSARASERDIRVETRDVIAVFTNRGARLKSWRLKHYLDQQGQPLELVEHELRGAAAAVLAADAGRCGRPRR